MNGLPFQQLPGATPQDTLQRDMRLAQQQVVDLYNQQLQIVRKTRMSDENFATQYNKLAQKFQTDLQKATQPFQQKIQQMQTIQRLVQQGHITSERGKEATWRMALPGETERAMFPSIAKIAKPAAPLSPTQLKSYEESAAEFVEAAKVTDRFWGPIPKPFTRWHKFSKEQLIKQYVGWQEYIGYLNLSPVRQHQADIQWDEYIRGQEIEEWNPNDPEIRALRPKGKLTRAVAPYATPMAKTIIQAKRTGVKQLTADLARQFLTEAGGDRDRARQIARSRGYSF